MESYFDELMKKSLWVFLLLPGFLSMSILSAILDLETTDQKFLFFSFGMTVVNIGLSLIAYFFVCLPIYGLLCLLRIWKPHLFFPTSAKLAIFCVTVLCTTLFLGVYIAHKIQQDTLLETTKHILGPGFFDAESSRRPLGFLLSRNNRQKLNQPVENALDGRPLLNDVVSSGWTLITMKTGASYVGFPRLYNGADIYLSPACEVRREDKLTKIIRIDGPGVIIPKTNMDTVTLVKRSWCFEYWNRPTGSRKLHSAPVER